VSRPAVGDRTPFFFGPPDRRLYGFYHGPTGHDTAPLAVLMCAPLGREYLNSHRCLQYLASRLAGGRCAVMRFDYFGTGDSDGLGEDVNMDGLLADTRTALAELCRRAGTRTVMILGLRAGATVACLLPLEGIDIDLKKLVLWDAFSDTDPEKGRWDGAQTWARGYSYTKPFLRALRGKNVSVGELARSARDTLIVETRDGDTGDRLLRQLEEENARGEIARFTSVPFFSQPGSVPFVVVNAVTNWATG
jgi:pimeloyl-ACP methyl ester carboxylesterase